MPQFRVLHGRAADVRIYLSALLIFLTSRLVVIAGIVAGYQLTRNTIPGQWDAGDAWYFRLLRWDSGWYRDIVDLGYSYSPDPTVHSTVAFYPLYPIVSFAVKVLLGVSTPVALLLVANIAALVAVLLLTKVARDQLGDRDALIAVALFCFVPMSVFLSAGYSEPLCLVFVLAGWLCLTTKRFVAAAVMIALALASRSVGFVMIPVMVWEIWRQDDVPLPQMLRQMVVCGLIAVSSLLAMMLYFGIEFGHPLAFAAAQGAWQQGTFLQRFLAAVTLQPFLHFDISQVWFLAVLVLSVLSFWRLPTGLALYAVGALALPYLTLGITGSMNRFSLMCFPAFMCLAVLCKGRILLASVLTAAFGVMLAIDAARFSQWYWVG